MGDQLRRVAMCDRLADVADGRGRVKPRLCLDRVDQAAAKLPVRGRATGGRVDVPLGQRGGIQRLAGRHREARPGSGGTLVEQHEAAFALRQLQHAAQAGVEQFVEFLHALQARGMRGCRGTPGASCGLGPRSLVVLEQGELAVHVAEAQPGHVLQFQLALRVQPLAFDVTAVLAAQVAQLPATATVVQFGMQARHGRVDDAQPAILAAADAHAELLDRYAVDRAAIVETLLDGAQLIPDSGNTDETLEVVHW